MKGTRRRVPVLVAAGGKGTRVFRGSTVDEALAGVRMALGPGAEILATRKRRKYALFGPVQAEVVARAPSPTAAHGITRIAMHGASRTAVSTAPRSRGDIASQGPAAAAAHAGPGPIQSALRELLVTAGVAPALATMLSVNSLLGETGHLVSARELSSRLGNALAEMVGAVRPVDLAGGGSRVIAFIGPHGGGKTTALAKLACDLVLAADRKVTLLTADTVRLGAADQLARYAAVLNSGFGAAYTPGELRRLRDEAAREAEVVLVDTPGCNWRCAEDLSNLASLLDAAHPDEVHLVVPAVYELTLAQHMVSAFRALGVDRLLIARLDEAETYGPVVNLVACCRLPLSYAGLGPHVPGTLWAPDPGHLARMLLAGQPPHIGEEQDEEAGGVGRGQA